MRLSHIVAPCLVEHAATSFIHLAMSSLGGTWDGLYWLSTGGYGDSRPSMFVVFSLFTYKSCMVCCSFALSMNCSIPALPVCVPDAG